MPKVEQYRGDRVQTQVVRQPRASGGQPGAGAQAAAVKGLSQLAVAGAQMKQRIDTTSAEEALVQFEREKNNLFFNPENGYFNTQGRDAYDAAESAQKTLEELKKKYGDTLNPNAQSLFNTSADAHIAKANVDIGRHASKGLQSWEVATIEAQVENSLENASLYWNQPQNLKVQAAVGRQAIIDAAEMQGLGAEATNERLQTFESSFTKSAITAATNSSSAEGQAMMDDQGSRLEGPDRVKLQKQIDAKAQAEKTQADARESILRATNLVDTYDSREEIRDQVNTIEDPELRKKTMTESMRQFNLKKQAESEARAAAFEDAENHIVEGGSAETYQAVDPEGWDRLSAEQKKSIQSGKAVITDWNTFSDLMTLPREELAKVNPVDHFSDLAPSERSKLVSAVKAANGTGSSADKIDHQVGRTRTSQTTAAVEQMLGKKSKWNDDKREQANSFYALLDEEVAFREQQKGSSLSSEEFTNVLSDLTRTVTIERSALGIDLLAPDVERNLTDVPPENVNILADFLRTNGIPVTIENLMKAQRQATQ